MSINVGVIGAGRIGKLHAENLVSRVPEAKVIAIADVVEEAAKSVAANLGIPQATARYEDILSNPDIQTVVICSSTDTHARIIIEAAEAGKHIFCEKPIDFSLARIDEALAAVKKAGVKLQIGFNRRFDPNFRRVRQAVVDGEIGEMHLLHIISRDPAPPPIEYIKVSGGLFFDMMIHDFDMSRFLTGSEALEVYTRAAVRVDPEIGRVGDVDTAVVMLTFQNGVIATIENSRQSVYGYDQRVEVFGSGGAASSLNQYASSVVLSTSKSVYRDLPLYFFLERYTESYIQEMIAFFDAVSSDTAPPVTGIDGRIPVLMAMAARKSYDENRPVKLSEVDS